MMEAENGIHTAHYKPTGNIDPQIHRHEHVETATNEGNGDWRIYVKISDDYAAHAPIFWK